MSEGRKLLPPPDKETEDAIVEFAAKVVHAILMQDLDYEWDIEIKDEVLYATPRPRGEEKENADVYSE